MDNYEMYEMLGHGSYGSVYRVMHRRSREILVLKRIVVRDSTESQKQSAMKEVQIMSAISSPYVVAYYDSFQSDGYYSVSSFCSALCIVMEYCGGGDLGRCLQANAPKTFLEERLIWKFILIGLFSLHQNHILHRDLKPANIFLNDGNVKIGDMGVATALGSSSAFASTLIGTPYYLSPELCKNEPYNTKSDMWALGCIIYECVTFNHPFTANNQAALILKILKGTYSSIPSFGGKYSSEMLVIVKMLLNRNNRERPDVPSLLRDPFLRSLASDMSILIPEVLPGCLPLYQEIVPSLKSKINPRFKRKVPTKKKQLPVSCAPASYAVSASPTPTADPGSTKIRPKRLKKKSKTAKTFEEEMKERTGSASASPPAVDSKSKAEAAAREAAINLPDLESKWGPPSVSNETTDSRPPLSSRGANEDVAVERKRLTIRDLQQAKDEMVGAVSAPLWAPPESKDLDNSDDLRLSCSSDMSDGAEDLCSVEGARGTEIWEGKTDDHHLKAILGRKNSGQAEWSIVDSQSAKPGPLSYPPEDNAFVDEFPDDFDDNFGCGDGDNDDSASRSDGDEFEANYNQEFEKIHRELQELRRNCIADMGEEKFQSLYGKMRNSDDLEGRLDVNLMDELDVTERQLTSVCQLISLEEDYFDYRSSLHHP